jgi:hypothetical protein
VKERGQSAFLKRCRFCLVAATQGEIKVGWS